MRPKQYLLNIPKQKKSLVLDLEILVAMRQVLPDQFICFQRIHSNSFLRHAKSERSSIMRKKLVSKNIYWHILQ